MDFNSQIEFVVRGKFNSIDISLENVSLSLLSSFTKDINDLLSTFPENKKSDIIVSIKGGSLKYRILIALVTLNAMKSEISLLRDFNDFSLIDNKRSIIYEGWFNRTQTKQGLEFEIIPSGDSGIKFNSDSNFKRTDENIWIEGEHFLYGTITDMGGTQKSNIHFVTEDNLTYLIDCTKDDILKESSNRIYHTSALRVRARQNIITGELRDAKFLSFVDYNPIYSEEQLMPAIKKGRIAWSDVSDHLLWIRNLRSEND